ncbi:MAG TPA: PilZ domain-containing protein [Acidimicrobiales bacterium]|nr:PilZ domain-containing protein [Acidimicrobiales bacterium]
MSEVPDMEHQRRRLIPRQFVDWEGSYLIEGDPVQHWRDCRVIDISSAGAGLDLMDTTVAEVEGGRRIFVNLRLMGETRHNSETEVDRIRVGIEFVELTEVEQAFLDSLRQLDARW